jgi:hypothetical protein
MLILDFLTYKNPFSAYQYTSTAGSGDVLPLNKKGLVWLSIWGLSPIIGRIFELPLIIL